MTTNQHDAPFSPGPYDRAAQREAALRAIRKAGEAEGIPPRLIAEGEISMRSAFAMSDAMDSIFSAMFGGRK